MFYKIDLPNRVVPLKEGWAYDGRILGIVSDVVLSQEDLDAIEDSIRNPSVLVLNKSNVEDLDFRLMDVKKGVTTYNNFRVDTREWLRVSDDKLAVRETFTYSLDAMGFVDTETSIIEWYKENGVAGVKKTRVQYFNNFEDKRKELLKTRAVRVAMFEEKIIETLGFSAALAKLANYKAEKDLFIDGDGSLLVAKIAADSEIAALNTGFIT